MSCGLICVTIALITPSPARHGVLKWKFLSLKFPESASMYENFTLITKILNELANLKLAFTNEEILSFVLDTLPSSWEVFGSILAL